MTCRLPVCIGITGFCGIKAKKKSWHKISRDFQHFAHYLAHKYMCEAFLVRLTIFARCKAAIRAVYLVSQAERTHDRIGFAS